MAPQASRKQQPPKPDRFHRTTCFVIGAGPHTGTVISKGDWFRFFGEEEQFKFLHHSVSPSGSESVDAYGGMPPKGNGQDSNSHGYQHRSFALDREFIPTKEKK